MTEINKTKLMEKAKLPAINPRQLLVFVLVQILGSVQGILPIIIGESFNPYWFLAMVIIDNVSYFTIMSLRSVLPEEVPDTTAGKLAEQLMKGLIDILSKRDLGDDVSAIDLLMDQLEYHVQWTMREWNTLYQERFVKSKEYYDKMLKAKNLKDEIKKLE